MTDARKLPTDTSCFAVDETRLTLSLQFKTVKDQHVTLMFDRHGIMSAFPAIGALSACDMSVLALVQSHVISFMDKIEEAIGDH